MDSVSKIHFSTIVDLLHFRAEEGASRTAFSFLDDGEHVGSTVTFAELARRALSLASHLQQHARQGDRVLLVYAPGIEYIVGFLACACAGLIAVPALPPTGARNLNRLQLMADDAQPSVIMTSAAVYGSIAKFATPSELAARSTPAAQWLVSDMLPVDDSAWTRAAIDGGDIAFLQYTSGSTGSPKGVQVSHANILANAAAIHDAFDMRTSDTLVSWLPPHHDMGLIGKIVYPLYAGCHCVQFPPAAFFMRPHRWLQAISNFKARGTAAPNFAFELCVDRITEERRKALDLGSLQYMLCGAEQVKPATIRRFIDMFSSCGLRPGAITPVYGLAESTLLVSHARHQHRGELQGSLRLDRKALGAERQARPSYEDDALEIMSVGSANSGATRVAIVDPESCMVCTDGAVGEIWVNGSSVAQGYWKREKESHAIFNAQIHGQDGAWLRTGDLGFISHGELYVTGRIKDMMIFNGRNIYPQDVEAAVEMLDPAFRKNGGAAFSIECDDGPAQLVIIQELETRATPAIDGLAARILAELAEQQDVQCEHLVLVKSGRIPRTSSGKIQRSQCRELFLDKALEPVWTWSKPAAGADNAEQVAPRSETEQALAEIWMRVLDLPAVSVHDNFFALGGQSVMGLQAVAALKRRFAIDLPIRALFESPSIAQLARHIDAALKNGDYELAPKQGYAIPAIARDGILPLSFAQRRLWFLEQLRPGSGFYNLPNGLRLLGKLDVAALGDTLDEIVRRHEVLRTVYRVLDEEPCQIIQPWEPVVLSLTDLSHCAEIERQTRIAELRHNEAVLPFDLSAGPMLRARLLRLGAHEHLLLLTLHHIAADGWSMGVLSTELAELYGNFSRHQEASLPALRIQYADFSHWQKTRLQGALLERQLTYWKAQLAGAAELLPLLTDRPRPAQQSYHGASRHFAVKREICTGLHALAARENATMFMVLAAVLQTLLARYSGQNDLCIGAPIAYRPNAELEPLVGFFVNSLVLRTHIDPALDFGALLRQVRRTALEAYEHQDVPFEQLVEQLAPVRSMSHAPLFQVVLTMLNTPSGRLSLPGLELETLENRSTTCEVDLRLNISEEEGALAAYFEYSTDLFDESTIDRFSRHFTHLLETVVGDASTPVGDLPLMPEEVQRQALVQWNRTAAEHSGQTAMHQLFEAQVQLRPDHPAIAFQDMQMSYGELNRRANRLARHLRMLGVGADTLVGLCLERSADMIVGLLAVLKAGGAYLPLDPNYPTARLSHMLTDSSLALLLTQEHLLDVLPANNVYALCIDVDDAWRGKNDGNLELAVQPDSLAYVIYTSGSTGRPKGTLLHHAGLANLAHAQAALFQVQPEDRVLQFASFNFDASTWEIAMALSWGATLCLASRDDLMPGAGLEQSMRRLGVTIATLPPTALALLNNDGLPALKTLIVAGEACPRPLVNTWASSHRFFNAYGPTESTICASAFNCSQGANGSDQGLGAPPIGLPIDNMRLYILDPRGNPVPTGAAGELHIAGTGLARGYINRPDLTAERFIPDPFSDAPGGRLYRSGDLVRRHADGNIEFLGRIDNQVKIRGFRIETGEIESALSTAPGVREALVMAREDEPGDLRLVGYVVRAQDASISTSSTDDGAWQAAIRQSLQSQLPDHMLPAHIVFLEQFPLTQNGKIDRTALPEPDRLRSAAHYLAPRTPEEEGVAKLFSEVLKLDRVGIDDNFFELGGHSLLATQVISKLRADFSVDIPLRKMFEAPTVAALAAEVESLRQQEPMASERIVAMPRGPAIPLSYAQQRLWFMNQMEPDNPFYNIPGAVRLTGQLDAVAFHRALNEIVRRHEVLRTTYSAPDGNPVQVIAPKLVLDLPLVDLSDLTHGEATAKTDWLVQDEAQTPFDLAAGPLMRARLLRLDAKEHVLLFTMHHIVSDGWSIAVMIREMEILYAAFAGNQASPLPELEIQYADYAQWQRSWLTGDVLQRQIDYWTGQLADAPPLLTLPTDRPRPAVQTYQGAMLSFVVPAAINQGLQSLARRHDSTLFMALMAAYAVMLSRYSGQNDICVGSPIANRVRVEIEPLIGFFVNTLVMRTRVEKDMDFATLLRQVRATTLDAYANQDLPFEQLVDALKPERNLSHAPIYQAMLILQNVPMNDLELPNLKLETVASDNAATKFDLRLSLAEQDGTLQGTFQYSTDLFDAGTIERMGRHFTCLLESIIAAPDIPVGKLGMQSAAERRRILAEINRDQPSFLDISDAGLAVPGTAASVIALFAETAQRQPRGIALEMDTYQASYRELDERSNQVANGLSAMGAVKGSVLAILLDDPVTQVIATIGAMKAGCILAALSNAHPRQRLQDVLDIAAPAYMILDAQSAVKQADLLHGQQQIRHVLMLERTGMAQTVPSPAVGGFQLTHADVQDTTSRHAVELAADDPCYLYFTSGSTGKPKAVLGRSGSLAHFIQWEMGHLGLAAQAGKLRVSQLTTPTFDAYLRDLFVALGAGGTICIPPSQAVMVPGVLADWLENAGITLMHCVPSVFRLLLDSGLHGARFPDLKRILMAGEALLPAIVNKWIACFGERIGLVNLYGATETTLVKFFYDLPSVPLTEAYVPIGRPMPGVQAIILKANLELCETGEIGELYVRTPYRSHGYYGRPDLTNAVFVRNPYSAGDGDILYKTGDLACALPDGNFRFLGRQDFQVKIRGMRVEVGEVEAALTRLPEVREAVVIARDGNDDKYLTAFVGAGSDFASLQVAQLRNALLDVLPDYMVPAEFSILERLPLSSNGKIDRKALLACEATAHRVEYLAPITPTQRTLAELFAKVLKREQVGLNDDFFELGGHSLQALMLLSRIRKTFELELPPRTLFEAPTIAQLAERVENGQGRAKGATGSGVAATIVPAVRGASSPLSFSQQRQWFLEQFDPGSAFYNIPTALRMRGELNIDALQRSLSEIVRRHESLRTTFDMVDGKPVQLVRPASPIPLLLADLSDLALAERAVRAHALALDEAKTGFDLRTGPLIRTALVRLAPDEHLCMLTVHHIISDGWSMGVLVREVVSLYSAYVEGHPSPLPELPIQYADFAHWQQQLLTSGVLQRQLSYWTRQLDGAPELLALPLDKPRPPVQSHHGARESFSISAGTMEGLARLAKRVQATLFMTLNAAFSVMLARYSGQSDICVGTFVANRSHAETEPLIGFFVNTLVLRTRVDGKASFEDLLRQVSATTLEAFSHQDVPFEHLLEAIKPARNTSYTPLFQALLVLQNAPVGTLELPGLSMEPLESRSIAAKFDLTLQCIESAGCLECFFEYNTDLFEAATVRRMAGHFSQLLDAIADNAQTQVAQLPMMSKAEEHLLLQAWNDTARDNGPETNVVQSFEEQAARTPDAIALACAGTRLSYQEFNARANQLAHHLRKSGVGPESLVGICVDRSEHMLIGILAILKAGGAYVPLDPGYPQARLAYMLDDARPSLLLTQAALLETLPGHAAKTLCLDAQPPAWHDESTANPPCLVQAGNLAYVIYTSGSTGKPKGVMVGHGELANLTLAQADKYRSAGCKAVLQFASINFDMSVEEIFPALVQGAQLVVRPADMLAPDREFTEFIKLHRIDALNLPAAFWHEWMNLFGRGSGELPDCLKLVSVGGEKVNVEQFRQWVAATQAQPCIWINAYGPTECTVNASYYQAPADGTPIGRDIPIGKPMANARIYLLDTELNPVPVGVAGELHIAGAGVARGYLHLAGMTAERFVPCPYGGPGERMYKTGDLARYLQDGNIEYLGRVDHQVKIRGFRIELGEIEAALLEQENVSEAVVLARQDASGDKQLVAYLTTADGLHGDAAALREQLAASLPGYMIPAHFLWLEHMPLTENGKIDRKALPEPDMRLRTANYAAPTTPTEATLAAIWAEVLQRDRIGIHDNFFASGGHSLLAVQLNARISEKFARQLSIRTLFRATTVAELARILDAESETAPGTAQGTSSSQPSIMRVSRESRRGRLRGKELVFEKNLEE